MTALALEPAEPQLVEPVPVQVTAGDPLLQAGVENCLRGFDELTVVNTPVSGSVAMIVTEAVDRATIRAIEAARRPVLLVATTLSAAAADRATRSGATGLLNRQDASPLRLRAALLAIAADRRAPGHPTTRPTAPALDDRERAVLSLLADGHETAEVARRLAYSVRTVTSVVHDITRRLRLRNRAHAVAHALREGLI